MNNITLVTGLWDLGRSELNQGWARNFEDHYLKKFKDFLEIPANLIIFGDQNLREFVNENKTHNNIQFIERDLSWFKQQFYQEIQKIRNNPQWFNQVGWLKESTQARLEMYNPLVMQKMFLLNDAKIMSRFNDDYIFWLDAGITNTVHKGYFTHDKVLEKIPKYFRDFSFVCFPYKAETEIHGFKYSEINKYAGKKIERVARGGFFGGRSSDVNQAMNIYYGLMSTSLNEGLMGTEESLFSIMVYKYPEYFSYFDIESNGLLGTFFENLKNDKLESKKISSGRVQHKTFNTNKVAVYIITFNSPNQVRTLIESFEIYDSDFIDKPQLYLLNNSTKTDTDREYRMLCEEYNMIELRFPENLGICGGRQYIAEHFDKSEHEFMFFFEDDMFFYCGGDEVCKNGFPRNIKNIYQNSLDIVNKEGYDFMKLCFTEFYGNNSTQWAWYNVPQSFREIHWPERPNLPKMGLDPEAPKVRYTSIRTHKGIPYADGEIYYCNWPQVVTKDGNKKMFLTQKWERPFEQTWMSYMFQETIKGVLKPAILLASPTEHDRFEHYEGKLRKES